MNEKKSCYIFLKLNSLNTTMKGVFKNNDNVQNAKQKLLKVQQSRNQFSFSDIFLNFYGDERLFAQFHIQLVYRPHFGTWILLFGPFGLSWQYGKKSGFEFFWATFEGGFFNFLWAKKRLKFFFKYCSVRTKMLHKIKLKFFFVRFKD